MTDRVDSGARHKAAGKVFRWPRAYDLLLRVFWGASEDRYRAEVLRRAGLRLGAAVLDVGCGTGTLAIGAANHLGASGRIVGIDASPEMVARARRKAAKAGIEAEFQVAPAEALPFPEATFDNVLSTTVLHCLAADARAQVIREITRVLKPRGRLLLVDFGGERRHGLIAHLPIHRRFELREFVPDLIATGLTDIEAGPLEFSGLEFVRAVRPAAAA